MLDIRLPALIAKGMFAHSTTAADHSLDLLDRARALDRIADCELAHGRRHLAERLSHRAAELREVAR